MAKLTVRTVDQLDSIDADGVKEAGDENSRFLLQSDGHPYSMTVGVAKQLFGTAGSGSGSDSKDDDSGAESGSVTSEVNQIDSYSTQMSYKAEDVRNLFNEFTVDEDVLNVTVHAYAVFSAATNGVNQLTIEIRTVKQDPENPDQTIIEWVPVCRAFTKGTFLQIDKHLCLYNGVSFRVAGYNSAGAAIGASDGQVYATYVNPSGREIGGSQKTYVVSFAKVGSLASPEVQMPDVPGIVETHVRVSMGDLYDSWCYGRSFHLQVKGITTNGNWRNMTGLGVIKDEVREKDLRPVYVSAGDKLKVVFGAKSTAHSKTGTWPANTIWFTWNPITALGETYPGITTSADTNFDGATVLRFGVKKNPKMETKSTYSYSVLSGNMSETMIGACKVEHGDSANDWSYVDISCGGGSTSNKVNFLPWSIMHLNPSGYSGTLKYMTNTTGTDLPGNYVMKCNNLKSVMFSDTVVPAWYRTLSGITIGDTVTTFLDNCFQWLSNWVPGTDEGHPGEFVVPANIVQMSTIRTFRNCRKMTRISFENPANITAVSDIGLYATFLSCTSLTAIDGLSGLTACTALCALSFAHTQVTRLDLRNIVQLGDSSMTSVKEPFLNCTKLQDIVLDYNNMNSTAESEHGAFSISKYLFASTKAKNGTFNIRILNVPSGWNSDEFLAFARSKLNGITVLKGKANVRLFGTYSNNFDNWDTFTEFQCQGGMA